MEALFSVEHSLAVRRQYITHPHQFTLKSRFVVSCASSTGMATVTEFGAFRSATDRSSTDIPKDFGPVVWPESVAVMNVPGLV